MVNQKEFEGDIINSVDSTMELKDPLYKCDINFIQFFVQRRRSDQEVGCCGRYEYRVQIEYYLEDTKCDGVRNQNKIQKFFEILDDLICQKLGNTWKGLVISWDRIPNRFPSIRRAGSLENRPIFVGSYEYQAEQTTEGCPC